MSMKEFDEYRLLKRGGARLPIDSLEFIDPIFEENNGEVKRFFYIAGVRHYIGCDGDNCEVAFDLNIGDTLSLEFEPTNKYDENAIKIMYKDHKHVGYLPRYYSESVARHLKNGVMYKCEVIEVSKDSNCNECIKVSLEIDASGNRMMYNLDDVAGNY